MPGEDSLTHFLSKLREILRGKISEQDFAEAVTQARSHTGGVFKKRRKDETKPIPEDDTGDDMDPGPPPPDEAAERKPRAKARCAEPIYMSEVVQFAEDGRTASIQVFPPVGKYDHPRYGTLDISPAFLKRVKANFDAKIYQQELPLTIDLEHQTSLSGAAGWISKVEIKGDKGLWATVELNDRGQALLRDDAYRYFSPEYYDEWTDPATGEQHKDVLVGGALTNRPFFKGMEPVLVASEGVFAFEEMRASGEGESAEDGEPEATELADANPEHYLYVPNAHRPGTWKLPVAENGQVTVAQLGRAAAALGPGGFRGQPVDLPEPDKAACKRKLRALYAKLGVKPEDMPEHIRAASEAGIQPVSERLAEQPGEEESEVGMSDDEAKAFRELGDSVKTLREELDAERKARETAEATAKTASERAVALERDAKRRELTEFVKANRLAFRGEVPEAVARLESYQAALSDEQFKDYLDERHAQHEAMAASEAFQQKGTARAPAGPSAELAAAIQTAGSLEKALEVNPRLYTEYVADQNRRVRRGGE